MRAFLSLLFSLGIATAQDQAHQFPASTNAQDIAIATDSAGRMQALVARTNANGNSNLDANFFDGSSWFSLTLDNHPGAGELYGVDLKVDRQNHFHATYYEGTSVIYAYLPAGTIVWQKETIVAGSATSSTRRKERWRTSLDLEETAEGVKVHLAYVSGPGDDPQAIYASRSVDGVWTRESVPVSGEFAAIAVGSIPQTGFSLQRRGPVIGYFANDEYLMVERRVTTNFVTGAMTVSWSTPEKLADGPGFTAADFVSLDLEIQGGVLHALMDGSADDGTSGVLYHQRRVGSFLNSPFLIKENENVARSLASSSSDTFAMSLDSSGTPLVTFVNFTNATIHALHWAQRTGRDSWRVSRFFESQNLLGEPEEAAITIDPLGRPVVAFTRLGGVSAEVRTDSAALSQESPITIPGTPDDRNVTSDLATDPFGGVGMVFGQGGQVVIQYLDPAQPSPIVTIPELMFAAEDVGRTIESALIAPVGEGFMIYARVLSENNSVASAERYRSREFIGRLEFGQLVCWELIGGSVSATPVSFEGATSFEGDFEFAYLATLPPSQSESAPEGVIRIFDPSCQQVITGVPDYQLGIDLNGLQNPQMIVTESRLEIVGIRGTSMLAFQDRSNGSFREDEVRDFETIAEVPTEWSFTGGPDREILIREGNALRLYSEDDARWEDRGAVLTGFDGFEVWSTTVNREIFVITRARGGANAGRVDFHTLGISEGIPTLITKNTIFSLADQPSVSFDRVGAPVVLAIDGSGAEPARRLSRSRLNLDADRDGLSLLGEIAFGKDPFVNNGGPSIEFRSTIGENFIESVLGFERPLGLGVFQEGNGDQSATMIEAGLFEYVLEWGQLDSMSPFSTRDAPFGFGGSLAGPHPEAGAPLGTGQRDGFVITHGNGNLPSRFYRIAVKLR